MNAERESYTSPQVGALITKTYTVVAPDGRTCKRDRDGRYDTSENGTRPCGKPATICVDILTIRPNGKKHRSKWGVCPNHMNPRYARRFNIEGG